MQAVSYLAQSDEVDPARIGAMGYSLGSFILGLTGAIEPRLRACVLVGGGNFDGPEGYWDRSGKKMCQSTPYRSLSFLGDRPAAIYALNARRGATLVYNGLADTVVSIPGQGESFFADLRQLGAAPWVGDEPLRSRIRARSKPPPLFRHPAGGPGSTASSTCRRGRARHRDDARNTHRHLAQARAWPWTGSTPPRSRGGYTGPGERYSCHRTIRPVRLHPGRVGSAQGSVDLQRWVEAAKARLVGDPKPAP